MRLEACREEAWLCNHCSMCSETINDDSGFYVTCPVYRQLRFEDSSARGHNTVAFYLLDGTLKYSKEVADCVYNCTTCASCEEICKPFGNMMAQVGGSALKNLINPVMAAFGATFDPVQSVQILEAMRADCVDLGLQPEPVKRMAVSTEQNYNPYEQRHADRLKWAQGLGIAEHAQTALFVGCIPSYTRQEVAAATANVLRGAGVKFAVLPDEWCCGSPLLRTGSINVAEKMISHNVEMLRENAVELLVTACAECYMAISKDWPKMAGGQLPFRAMHISEYMARLISARKIRLKHRIKATVTYHDPCHLGREMGVYDEPRAVLRAIPGVKVVEMYPTKHAAWCCGAGGGLKESHPDLALEIGADKLPLVKAAGASVLASSCPFCKTNFKDAVEEADESIEVRDLTELVAASMGV